MRACATGSRPSLRPGRSARGARRNRREPTDRRRRLVAAGLGVLLALSACVSRPHVPWEAEVTLPSEVERAGIRTVGILAAETLPDSHFTSGQISQSLAAAGGAVRGV